MENIYDNVYRKRSRTGNFRYFLKLRCEHCGEYYYTDKYKPSEYCSDGCRRFSEPDWRGRPIGHKLSNVSRDKIADGMTGRIVSKDHRQKTSASVTNYFKDHPEARDAIADRMRRGI